jgi:hypothetical protein
MRTWGFSPKPSSFLSINPGGHSEPVLQFRGKQADFPHQRQIHQGLTDFSSEQLTNPESEINKKRSWKSDMHSPVIMNPFIKERVELLLYLGSLH